jgi:hypothetical protein
MKDLTFQQLQDVPGLAPNTFYIGLDGLTDRNFIGVDINKLMEGHNPQPVDSLELEEVCVFIWKLLDVCYKAQERYNSTKEPESPSIRAFVRPTVTIESTQAEIPIGIGRGVVNVRVPFVAQTIDPQTES